MTPDAKNLNADPAYLRDLVARSGLSRRHISRLLGLTWNGFYNYLRDEADPVYRPAPYTVQFALECLVSDSLSNIEIKGD